MILNYKSIGEGPPLIILHGLFGSLDNWMTVGRQIAENYTVFLVDQRNHGQSFHDDEFSYPEMAKDLKDLVDHHDLQDFAILGHSMGGKTAMFYTAEFPASVSRLIVVDIAPRFYPVHHKAILDGLKSIDLKSIASRNEADLQLKKYVAEAPVRQFLMKNLKRTQDGGFEWKINLPVIDQQIENVGDALPENFEVNAKTLFIKGENSDYIKESDQELIQRQFPNSTIATVDGAGHWVHAQAPDALIDLVSSFLGDY